MILSESDRGHNALAVLPERRGTAIDWRQPQEYEHISSLCPNYSVDMTDPLHPSLILDTSFVVPPHDVTYNERLDQMLLIRVPFDDFIEDVISIVGRKGEVRVLPATAQIVSGVTEVIGDMNMFLTFSTFRSTEHTAEMLASILLHDILSWVHGSSTRTLFFSEELLDNLPEYTRTYPRQEYPCQDKRKNDLVKQVKNLEKRQNEHNIYAVHSALERLFINDEGAVSEDGVVTIAMLMHQASLGFTPRKSRTLVGGREQRFYGEKGGGDGCYLIINYDDKTYRYEENVSAPSATDIEKSGERVILIAQETYINCNANESKIVAQAVSSPAEVRSLGRETLGSHLVSNYPRGQIQALPRCMKLTIDIRPYESRCPLVCKVPADRVKNAHLVIQGNDMTGFDNNIIVSAFYGDLKVSKVKSVQVGTFQGTLRAERVGAELHAGARLSAPWGGPGISIETMSGKISSVMSKISMDHFFGDHDNIVTDDRSEIAIDGKIIRH